VKRKKCSATAEVAEKICSPKHFHHIPTSIPTSTLYKFLVVEFLLNDFINKEEKVREKVMKEF
jgi:hypothetical protein